MKNSQPKLQNLRPPLTLLERLSNAMGVSGDEEEIRRIVIEQILFLWMKSPLTRWGMCSP
jgi:putative aminopeptidase FrvX